MEQEQIKREPEQPTIEVTPVVEIPTESVEVVSRGDYPLDKRSSRGAGKPTNAERADIDLQKRDMRLMAGHILLHFKQMVIRKELDFSQELQLFKELSKYIGYSNDGNKIAEDIGMDTFAMKYLEINTKIKSVAEKQTTKGKGKR